MSWPLIIGIIAIVLVLLAVLFVKRLLWFAINSAIGLFALMGWNILFPTLTLPVNFWTVMLIAISGIFGLIGLVLWQVVFG